MDHDLVYYLHQKLWKVLELLQRVNMLCDIDEEEFNANNARCIRIKDVINALDNENKNSLNEAKALLAEYLDIFSDEKTQDQ